MKPWRLIAITFFIIYSLQPVGAQKLHAIQSPDGVLVLEGKDSVLFYTTITKSLKDGSHARADYIHPLWGINGGVLTLDFPDDHPHHRGIFWAWRQISAGGRYAGDSWVCKDFSWDVKHVSFESQTDSTVIIQSTVYWKTSQITDNQNKQLPFVLEQVAILIYKRNDHYRLIDVEVRLKALIENVTIAGYDNESELSGFSIRMKTPDDLVFLSSGGKLMPQWPAITAGPWVDISGTLTASGGKEGITIFTYNDNPPPYNTWNIRQKDSMQNIVFPGREPIIIPMDDFIVLKYRLVVHDDRLDAGRMDKLYQSFNH